VEIHAPAVDVGPLPRPPWGLLLGLVGAIGVVTWLLLRAVPVGETPEGQCALAADIAPTISQAPSGDVDHRIVFTEAAGAAPLQGCEHLFRRRGLAELLWKADASERLWLRFARPEYQNPDHAWILVDHSYGPPEEVEVERHAGHWRVTRRLLFFAPRAL
jgi:hypothetical protein